MPFSEVGLKQGFAELHEVSEKPDMLRLLDCKSRGEPRPQTA